MSSGGGSSGGSSKIKPVPQANLQTSGWGGMGYGPSAQPQTFTPEAKPAWMQGVWDMPTWGYSPATGQAFTQRPVAQGQEGNKISLQPGYDPNAPAPTTPPPGTDPRPGGGLGGGKGAGRPRGPLGSNTYEPNGGSPFSDGNLFQRPSNQPSSMDEMMAQYYGWPSWKGAPYRSSWADHNTQG